MPPKAENTKKEGNKKHHKKASCGIAGPGPKYKLKTLVGYDDHCHSKLRNPAYSIGFKQTGGGGTCGPGPKYLFVLSRKPGFTIGHRMDTTVKCSPGPYNYDIPNYSPKFSMRFRTPGRCGDATPGPYNLPDKTPGPAFTIGKRPDGVGCSPSPGPYPPYNIDITKPRPPAFTIGNKQTSNDHCLGPGPIYNPKMLKKSPDFTFGMKHSECSPPMITECDEKC